MPKPVLLCLLVPMTRSAALRVQLFSHCLLGLVPPGDCKSRRTLQGAEALHTEPGDPVRTRTGGPQGCAWCLGAPALPAAPWRLHFLGAFVKLNKQQGDTQSPCLSAVVGGAALPGPLHTAGKEHQPPRWGQPEPACPIETTSLCRTPRNRTKPGFLRCGQAVLLGLVPSMAVPTDTRCDVCGHSPCSPSEIMSCSPFCTTVTLPRAWLSLSTAP